MSRGRALLPTTLFVRLKNHRLLPDRQDQTAIVTDYTVPASRRVNDQSASAMHAVVVALGAGEDKYVLIPRMMVQRD
jgi:hypothetical protein